MAAEHGHNGDRSLNRYDRSESRNRRNRLEQLFVFSRISAGSRQSGNL